jgi:hypothetical protein
MILYVLKIEQKQIKIVKYYLSSTLVPIHFAIYSFAQTTSDEWSLANNTYRKMVVAERKNPMVATAYSYCIYLSIIFLKTFLSLSILRRYFFKHNQRLDVFRLWKQIKGLNGSNFISTNFYDPLSITCLCSWTTTHIYNPLWTVIV